MALVPKHIKQLGPYKPGTPIQQVQRELGFDRVIKLASNENPLGPSKKVLEVVSNALIDCHRYPDSSGYQLRTMLAERFKLKIENVVLGAGSEGIMSVIMRTFLIPTDEILAARNSFIGFRVLANASGNPVNWVKMNNYRYDLRAMAEQINEYTKVIYLANPDNPTGTYFTVTEFDKFMEYVPERTIVIFDEAYFEYAKDIEDCPDSMFYRYDNVITLRTFSKVYGLAGIRLGYGFAHENLISNLLKVKLPFEPSYPAQIAGISAIEDEDFLERSLSLNQEGKKYILDELNGLGFSCIPSVTNFITVKLKNKSETQMLCDELLKRGIIVRPLAGFGWPECVRISIGTMEENIIFIESIKEIKKEIDGIYIH